MGGQCRSWSLSFGLLSFQERYFHERCAGLFDDVGSNAEHPVLMEDVVLAVLVMVDAFALAPANELAWVLDVDFALQLDFRGIDVSAFVPDDEAERAVFA